MIDALSEHSGTISIGGPTSSLLIDDIDGLAGSEEELAHLVTNQDQTASRYGMEIKDERTKLMTNSANPITTRITVAQKKLIHFNNSNTLVPLNEQGSKAEILARAAQNSGALGKQKPTWRDQNISLQTKVKLLYALI